MADPKNKLRADGTPRRQKPGEDSPFAPHALATPPTAESAGRGTYVAPEGMTLYTPQSPSSLSWWRPLAYGSSGSNETLANSANALIPSFTDTEASSIGKWLGSNFTGFGYDKISEQETAANQRRTAPVSTSALRRQMFSKERAQTALSNLASMEAASGSVPVGSDYEFLKNTILLLDKYSNAEGGISRANYAAMMKEFGDISKSADSSYVELGRAIINPTVDGTPLIDTFKYNGRTNYGSPNKNLFI